MEAEADETAQIYTGSRLLRPAPTRQAGLISGQERPAADVDGLPGHEPRARAAEEAHDRGDVVGRAA